MLILEKMPKLPNNNTCLEGISYLYLTCTTKDDTVLCLGKLVKKGYKESNN